VDLLALITPANSTAQIFAGTSYYGTDYAKTSYAPQTVVPFLAGPNGIANAIDGAQTGQKQTAVTASGWGAGQTGTALGNLAQEGNTDALKSVGLVILDNNTNRAGGGFWTTYYPFAPLLLTTADPTPNDLTKDGLTAPVLDVAYEYNINSDAPVDPLNPFALGNSLAAYAYGYGEESSALNITQDNPGDLPVLHQANGTDVTLQPGTHYIVKDGNVINSSGGQPGEPVDGHTTYITVATDELPLTRPLRLLPGGDILANAIDPTMTELVNAGYNDGKGTADNPAIPQDPNVTRPMKPGSSLTGLSGVPGSVPEGLGAGVETAGDDVTNPTTFVTKPLGEAGKLPVISSLPSLSPSTLTNTSVVPKTLTGSNPNFFAPVLPGTGNNKSSGSSATGGNLANNFTDQVKNAVDKVTGGLTGAKTNNGS
jgi:hypothetical protein